MRGGGSSHTDPRPLFGVVVTCIDGRIQRAVQEGLRQWLEVDFIDVVTLPGADAVLAERPDEAPWVWHALQVSLVTHAAQRVVIVGHTDCAANPVTALAHSAQISQAVETLRDRLGVVEVEGMLLDVATGSLDPVPVTNQPARAS